MRVWYERPRDWSRPEDERLRKTGRLYKCGVDECGWMSSLASEDCPTHKRVVAPEKGEGKTRSTMVFIGWYAGAEADGRKVVPGQPVAKNAAVPFPAKDAPERKRAALHVLNRKPGG